MARNLDDGVWWNADEGAFNVPQFSLDFDLDSEHGLDAAPAERIASIGYGIAGLEEGSGAADGQGIALVVDAEVHCLPKHAKHGLISSLVHDRAVLRC